MDFLYIKALHIIFVVAWFAGLFYLVRLFIYNTEAQYKDEIARPILTKQFLQMQNRLLIIIAWPAAIGSIVFGVWMLWLNPSYLQFPWMWLKIGAVVLLALYHLKCHSINSKQHQGIYKWGSFKLRLFNEVPTILLVAIVFLVVVKSSSGLMWGLLGTVAFGIILFGMVNFYKKQRNAKENENEIKTLFKDEI